MPYRIQDIDKETYLKLVECWLLNSRNMMDGLRDLDNLDNVLSVWPFYRTKNPNVFFWLSSVQRGHMAEFHVLNSIGKKATNDLNQYFPVIREIFTEFNLQRLTSAIPVSAPDVINGAKMLKFIPEGIIRKGAIFDGGFVDLELLGLLREEVPGKEKKYRKRNQTRRKRPGSNKYFNKNKEKVRTEKKAA